MLTPTKSLTTVILILLAALQAHARYGGDAKRQLASELIANSDKHKDRSLRDVLDREQERLQTTTTKRTTPEKRTERTSAGYSGSATVEEKLRTVRMGTTGEKKTQARAEAPPLRRPRTLSELFAWAIRMTTDGSTEDVKLTKQESVKEALPPPPAAVGEAESLAASVRALSDVSAGVRVRALVQLEELCHSVDNGRDMAKSGGVEALSESLVARESTVRSAAALAMATCAQNNPTVGNASVIAIPSLARLAAYDSSSLVRARALFAINAIMELHKARTAFEGEPAALPAVHRSLRSGDARATRRGLNLCELLVAKNLETWKPMLEAWDIPVLIERLMREHRDIDVRESAARVIASLDGRVLS